MDGGSKRPMTGATGSASPIAVVWLGRVAYRDAWALQRRLVDARVAGDIPDHLLVLEHEAVLTLGRQADESHVLATPRELRRRGIEVLRVERGGEVTYHGPGQLVAYPILRLGDRGVLIRPLVRALEEAMIETCAALGVRATRREGHPGCWIVEEGGQRPPRKIGALGIRVERGVTYHGIALNIAPDLRDFELIDACGLPGVISTSIAEEVGRSAEPPNTDVVRRAAEVFAGVFGRAMGADLEWLLGPVGQGEPNGLDGMPAGNDGTPVGNDGTPVGNDSMPVGLDGMPVGNDGTPVGNDGTPVGLA
ncbi:MAG: lipoyl(octanoyl) transferase LipB [Chloroflexi bacterium]|nr:lipoyl(octanoyl) transferase LipB [Chloroflexota bacterium]